MNSERAQLIRSLFDRYIEMYAARDERLVDLFSDDFTGYAGSSDVLVKDRSEWVRVTLQDFSQVPDRIRIEMRDLALQDFGDDVVVTTAFFHIHLPVREEILSRETARLVLIFRREGGNWKISHSGISIPFGLAADGEIYPMNNLNERNRMLELLVAERTLELAEANRRLEILSNTDGMTGLANRRSFDRHLEQEWNRGYRLGASLSVIMIDLDRFKQYNDYYGHLAGDGCLQAVAKILLKAARRAGEVAARYGGDEFIVLLPNTAESQAMEVAQWIQQKVGALLLPHRNSPHCVVTASLGVATLEPSDVHGVENFLRLADEALYSAKHSGGARVCAAGANSLLRVGSDSSTS